MNTLRALTLSLIAAGCIASAQAQGVRAEVGKPLQQASEYLKQGKAKEALAKVREADAVGNKTAAEQLTIDRMKAAAAQRAGDMGTAIAALEGIAGKVSGAEAGLMHQRLDHIAAAITALETFLRLAPDGPQAARVKGLLEELRQRLN